MPGLLVVAVLVIWGPALGLGFASDDVDLVQKNTLTGSWSQALAFFTTDLWSSAGSGGGATGYWRPLFGLSLTLDRSLWGEAAWGHHLQSLLWHAAGVVGLWTWARRLSGAIPAAVVAMIYGFHPIQTESVVFISARNDTMAVAGLVWAGVLWSRPGAGRGLVGALLLLGACLSKESVVLATLLLPLLGAEPSRRLVFAGAAVGGWAALRFGLGPAMGSVEGAFSLISSAPSLLAHYAGLLVWPWPLSDSVSVVYDLPGVGHTALACVGVVLGATGLVLRGGRRAALGLGLAALTAAPTAVAVATYHLMADRYATLPLVGLCLALAAAIPDRPLAAAPLAAVFPVWMVLLSLRIPDWQDSLTLAESAAMRTPSPYSEGWLGEELRRVGRPAEALPWYLRALRGQPPFCKFAPETVRAGMASGQGIAAGQAAYDAGCAGEVGFREVWAAAHLREGHPEGADRIMSPRPEACERANAAVLVALAAWRGQPLDAASCAAQAGVSPGALQRAVQALGPTASDP